MNYKKEIEKEKLNFGEVIKEKEIENTQYPNKSAKKNNNLIKFMLVSILIVIMAILIISGITGYTN